jgi:hypothetical protein
MSIEKEFDYVPTQKHNLKPILIVAVGAVLALTVFCWIAWPKENQGTQVSPAFEPALGGGTVQEKCDFGIRDSQSSPAHSHADSDESSLPRPGLQHRLPAFVPIATQMEELVSHQFEFKKKFPKMEDRSAKSVKTNPKAVSVIIEKASFSTVSLPRIYNSNYIHSIMDHSLSVTKMIQIINSNISNEEELSLYVNGRLLQDDEILRNIYDSNKEEDGFLYVVYV